MAPVTGSAVRPRRRIAALDALRGLTLLSMIAYHTCWDLVYLFRMDWEWYRGTGAYIWQQSICWTFILLSLIPWLFLFLAGYFLRRLLDRPLERLDPDALRCPPLCALGRWSLPVYMLHQPVVYGVLLAGAALLGR